MPAAHSPYLKHIYVCVNRRDQGVTCCAAGGERGAAWERGAAGGESGAAAERQPHGASSGSGPAPVGGEEIREKLRAFVKASGLKGKVRVSQSGCMDLCAQGPNVMVYPDNLWYHYVTLEEVDRIIEEHLAPLVLEGQAKRSEAALGCGDAVSECGEAISGRGGAIPGCGEAIPGRSEALAGGGEAFS